MGKPKNIVVGSTVLVDFKGNANNGATFHQVKNKRQYDNCVLEEATLVATEDKLVSFEEDGTFYYVSAVGCAEGQKVVVNVKGCPVSLDECPEIQNGSAK